jgi:hypothetical protein
VQLEQGYIKHTQSRAAKLLGISLRTPRNRRIAELREEAKAAGL